MLPMHWPHNQKKKAQLTEEVNSEASLGTWGEEDGQPVESGRSWLYPCITQCRHAEGLPFFPFRTSQVDNSIP